MQQLTIKQRVYRLVEPVENENVLERTTDLVLLLAIFVSVVTLIIGTVPSVAARYGSLIDLIETGAVAIFSAEYLTRLWTCTVNEKYSHPLWGRLRFALTPMMLIDLLAVLPFYLSALGAQFVVLRVLRLFRIFRVLKINRYSAALDAIRGALREKGPELLLAVSMMLTLIILASTSLYYAEAHVPDTPYTSIPAAMWTAVAGLTPLGFDGMFPDTVIGRILMVLIAIFGVGTFALPSGIFASAFSSQLQNNRKNAQQSADDAVSRPIYCPNCGHIVANATKTTVDTSQ